MSKWINPNKKRKSAYQVADPARQNLQYLIMGILVAVFIASWILFLWLVYGFSWADWYRAALWAVLPTGVTAAASLYLYKRRYPDPPISRMIYGIVLIAAIATPLILYAIGFLTLAPPEPTAPELAEGYAMVRPYDALNEKFVTSGEVYVISYVNDSHWLTVNVNTAFYVHNLSYGVVNCPGYYNVTIFLETSGGDDPADYKVNTPYVWNMSADDDVTMMLSKIDGVPGVYSASDISDGHHTITISLSVIGGSRGVSIWGTACFIPYTLVNKTHAFEQQVPLQAGWLAFNGTVENVEMWGYPRTTYSVPGWNVTNSYGVEYDVDIIIEADFTGLTNISLYYGFIDDYDNYIEIV